MGGSLHCSRLRENWRDFIGADAPRSVGKRLRTTGRS